jgi:hypothetical protein
LQVAAGKRDSSGDSGGNAQGNQDGGAVPPHSGGRRASDVVQDRGVEQPVAGADAGADDLDEERLGHDAVRGHHRVAGRQAMDKRPDAEDEDGGRDGVGAGGEQCREAQVGAGGRRPDPG